MNGFVKPDAVFWVHQVMDPIQIFNHPHTYGNHPVPCAVGVLNLQIIREEDLVRKSAAMGPA